MKEGISFVSTETVVEANTAKSLKSGDLLVYATPAMAALMENAAMNCVAEYLPEGSTTVGSLLEISHNRPSGLGESITAAATLETIEGRKLTFSVVASDSQGIIGKGKHVRFVVDADRFLSKI